MVLVALGALVPTPVKAQKTLEFSGLTWQATGEFRLAEDLDGRRALQVRTAFVPLTDSTFSDGTVEVWLRNSGIRSFFGVGFRMEENGFEDVYVRPHQSGRFDALQYTPVFHRQSGWQIYPEYNTLIELQPDRWQRLRIVVDGPRLQVFFGDSVEPVLQIDELERGKTTGALALKGFLPPGTPPEVFPNAFADLKVTPARATVPYPPQRKVAADSGLVARWALSPTFPEPEDPNVLPKAPKGDWRNAKADGQGRINIARWHPKIAGKRRSTVLARVILTSPEERVLRLGYGFSDAGTVFLNGRPVVREDNTYISRSKRYLGIMRVENDILFLPLRKGDNELVVLVSEQFGGWGLTAQLLDGEGITVRAAPPTGASFAP